MDLDLVEIHGVDQGVDGWLRCSSGIMSTGDRGHSKDMCTYAHTVICCTIMFRGNLDSDVRFCNLLYNTMLLKRDVLSSCNAYAN
jgi:hypothetical protein